MDEIKIERHAVVVRGVVDHRWAHTAVAYALKKRILVRPSACEKCKRPARRTAVKAKTRKAHTKTLLQAHHPDYNDLLRVEWLCDLCHGPGNPHVKNPRGAEGERALYFALRERLGDPVQQNPFLQDNDGEVPDDEGSEPIEAWFCDRYGGYPGDGMS